MKTVAGIFKSQTDAKRAAANLRAAGFADDHINFLAPGTTPEELESAVPTTETEQPGMGKAMGGAVGGALGAAGGLSIGAAAASLFVPGVGPVIAAGILGAALFGSGGAAAGAAAGDVMEDNIADGLPHDELYVYEDALRRGRAVVIALADDDTQAEAARNVLAQSGAESLDAARESWWIGLRDAEQETYAGEGRDFKTDEPYYRHGFEASLHPKARTKSYEDASAFLQARYKDEHAHDAFQRGYKRGQVYQQSFGEKYKR